MYIKDVFKQFCEERHAEDKGRNYNLLQEVYSKVEFFDISSLNVNLNTEHDGQVTKDNYIYEDKILLDTVLPFSTCFIKVKNMKNLDIYVFLREYNPLVITGTSYLKHELGAINIPITIQATEGKLYINKQVADNLLEGGMTVEQVGATIVTATEVVVSSLKVLANLPKHTVISDIPTHNKASYYRRKGESTIKVSPRPVYYVLNKDVVNISKANIKAKGRLELNHSFKVRGHYRRISPNSYGKDRYGEYKLKGITYVVEHVKGTGELVQRLHVVK